MVDADVEEDEADVEVDVGGGFLVSRRAGVLVSSIAVRRTYVRHYSRRRRISLTNGCSSLLFDFGGLGGAVVPVHHGCWPDGTPTSECARRPVDGDWPAARGGERFLTSGWSSP